MPRKHDYSQHFLRSPRLVAELIGHTNIRKNDIVYDLGAGSGVITSVLARRVREVFAVEIESDALRQLRTNMRDTENVAIIEADILTLQPTHDSYKIFANPPFSISSQLVRHFTQLDKSPKVLYLITQRQFARKIVPSDQHFTSQLGIEIAPWYTARIRRPLRKTDFTPPPAVDTVLLELKKRETSLLSLARRDQYVQFVEQCFTNQKYFSSIPHRGISERHKPSELPVDKWVTLFTAHS